jgi:leucyl-tRNA synthetase
LERVWNLGTGPLATDPDAYDDATRRLVHKTIRKVTMDIEALHLNTAISAMMILVRHLGGLKRVPRDAVVALTLVLSPFAPHLGEEIWHRLGHAQSLAHEPWPEADPALVRDEVVEIGVQVNGKLRTTITIAADADETVAREAALQEARMRDALSSKRIKRVIYVQGKILNFLVE